MLDKIGFIATNANMERLLLNENLKCTNRYKCFMLDKKPDKIFIRGSFHKFQNDGQHNYDDYKLSNYVETLGKIQLELGINTDLAPYYCPEFGVNIAFDAGRLINSIKAYRGKTTKSVEPVRHGIEIVLSQFRLKIYNKHTQTDGLAPINTIRIEISYEKTEKYNNVIAIVGKATTLTDLADTEKWRRMGNELLKQFDNLIIIEDDQIDLMKKSGTITAIEAFSLKKGVTYWENMTRMQKKRHFDKIEESIKKYSSPLKSEVRNLIERKIDELIDIDICPADVMLSPAMVTNLPTVTILPADVTDLRTTKYVEYEGDSDFDNSKIKVVEDKDIVENEVTILHVDEGEVCNILSNEAAIQKIETFSTNKIANCVEKKEDNSIVEVIPVNVNMVVCDSAFRNSEVTESLRAEIQYSLDNGLITEARHTLHLPLRT